jgi:hypothetical protein
MPEPINQRSDHVTKYLLDAGINTIEVLLSTVGFAAPRILHDPARFESLAAKSRAIRKAFS